MMQLADDLFAAVAAYRHIGVLWPLRHRALERRWVRKYLLQIRSAQDQVGWLAEAMRREREEHRMRQGDGDETRAVAQLCDTL